MMLLCHSSKNKKVQPQDQILTEESAAFTHFFEEAETFQFYNVKSLTHTHGKPYVL